MLNGISICRHLINKASGGQNHLQNPDINEQIYQRQCLNKAKPEANQLVSANKTSTLLHNRINKHDMQLP